MTLNLVKIKKDATRWIQNIELRKHLIKSLSYRKGSIDEDKVLEDFLKINQTLGGLLLPQYSLLNHNGENNFIVDLIIVKQIDSISEAHLVEAKINVDNSTTFEKTLGQLIVYEYLFKKQHSIFKEVDVILTCRNIKPLYYDILLDMGIKISCIPI